jgi:hypothetical protein
MALILAQVRLARTTLLPEDVVINTFAFGTPAAGEASPADLDAIVASLEDFYKTAGVTTRSIASYLSTALSSLALKHEIRLYDESAAPGSPPVRSSFFTMTINGGTLLPAEVALCMSFKAVPVALTPIRRRRGRVYIGPFASDSLGTTSLGDARPTQLLQETIADAGKRLADAAGHGWSVFSRFNGVAAEVVEIWVDNAWDTQRRRGSDPSSRITRLKT